MCVPASPSGRAIKLMLSKYPQSQWYISNIMVSQYCGIPDDIEKGISGSSTLGRRVREKAGDPFSMSPGVGRWTLQIGEQEKQVRMNFYAFPAGDRKVNANTPANTLTLLDMLQHLKISIFSF